MHIYILACINFVFKFVELKMTLYESIKVIHIITVLISITGFLIRGIWMMQSSSMLQQRWVKVAPHINDTILLLSAIALVVMSSQYPGAIGWINAKIVALGFYIILGTIALKRGKTRAIRIAAWCSAILVFSYILVVAVSKNVLPI